MAALVTGLASRLDEHQSMRATETGMGSAKPNEAGRLNAAQKRKTWHRPMKVMFSIFAGLLIFSAAATTIFFLYQLRDLPTVPEMRKGCLNVDGGEFEGLYRPLPLAEIPSLVQQAFLGMVDTDFYMVRPGREPLAIFVMYYQCAINRDIFCDPPGIDHSATRQCLSIGRKKYYGNQRLIKESLLYLRIATGLTRDERLEIYLNSIYLGHKAYGVEAGARTYFGKSAAELTIAEVAQMAALARARMDADPLTDLQQAKERKIYVLDRMAHLEIISEEEAMAAKKEEIAFIAIDR